MHYTTKKLDGRYVYRDYFAYCLAFSINMSGQHGPIAFNDALKWFTDNYGWSAEVRQWHKIKQWSLGHAKLGLPIAIGLANQTSEYCNPHWSWTNGQNDLRIYLASDLELAFFQLRHPVDQKRQ
jgi:hypothetical protein